MGFHSYVLIPNKNKISYKLSANAHCRRHEITSKTNLGNQIHLRLKASAFCQGGVVYHMLLLWPCSDSAHCSFLPSILTTLTSQNHPTVLPESFTPHSACDTSLTHTKVPPCFGLNFKYLREFHFLKQRVNLQDNFLSICLNFWKFDGRVM